ncbi:MAG TPA: prephenate dehydratase domain-containing protein [Patescibacteria group bacterium]|nr:prephenate dehydratase domain-containing protein [Patescibacteria group bacterium]
MEPKKVAFQGEVGSHHEGVTKQKFADEDIEMVYMASFSDVYTAVANGTVDQAIVAVGNTNITSISDSTDALLTGRFYVRDDIFYEVKHSLGGVEGATIEGAREIHSNVHALRQCTALFKRLPGVLAVPETDTAKSARQVKAAGDVGILAIASAEALEVNGLVTVEADVQDPHNYTRFMVVEKLNGQRPRVGHTRTTMLITINNTPKSLADALAVFGEDNIDLSLIETPGVTAGHPRTRVLVEVKAGLYNRAMQSAMGRLVADGTVKVRFIGSYNGDELPAGEYSSEEWEEPETNINIEEFVASLEM